MQYTPSEYTKLALALSLALPLVCSGAAYDPVTASGQNVDLIVDGSIEIDGGSALAVVGQSGYTATVIGSTIKLSSSLSGARGASGHVVLGNDATESLSVDVEGSGVSGLSALSVLGAAQIDVAAKTVEVNVKGTGTSKAYGILAKKMMTGEAVTAIRGNTVSVVMTGGGDSDLSAVGADASQSKADLTIDASNVSLYVTASESTSNASNTYIGKLPIEFCPSI